VGIQNWILNLSSKNPGNASIVCSNGNASEYGKVKIHENPSFADVHIILNPGWWQGNPLADLTNFESMKTILKTTEVNRLIPFFLPFSGLVDSNMASYANSQSVLYL
jgi:hypothetical protein